MDNTLGQPKEPAKPKRRLFKRKDEAATASAAPVLKDAPGKKPLEYAIVMFKIKGHSTWRITNKTSFKDVPMANVTETKEIKIDRVSGKITLPE